MPLAALIALGLFALARADEGAFKSLAGMAQAAPAAGPEADDAPTDAAPKMGALRDAVADIPSPRAAASSAPSPAAAAPAPSSAAKPAPAPAAAAPAAAASAPRLWTRLYSTLLPSWRPPQLLSSSFEAPLSTGSAAVRSMPPPAPRSPLSALMPPPDSEAVTAGERRGMAELMSVTDPSAQ